jgi:2,4-dienoyl-CoA reductase-like NADH-dependent reductase (Old Yellow Enzyme family)
LTGIGFFVKVKQPGRHGPLTSFNRLVFNRRNDSWGGSEDGRFRFLKETVTTVQDAVPDHMPVLVKLNANDYTPRKGITPNLAANYAKRLVELGVAAVEISCGTDYGFQTIRGEIPGAELARALPAWMRPIARLKMRTQAPASRFREAYNLDDALAVRPVLKGTPLILVGGLRRLSHMEALVTRGAADMIAMSRPFIREPSLVRRFAEGKATEASCISCNRCFAAMFNAIAVRCYQKSPP